jgi:hypothetical protein
MSTQMVPPMPRLSCALLAALAMAVLALSGQAAFGLEPEGAPAAIDGAAQETADEDGDTIPKWVWATLIMTGFVALSVATMALIRWPVRNQPPPVEQGQGPGGPAAEDAAPQSPSANERDA